MAFTLPDLPYAHDALEPIIDKATMEIPQMTQAMASPPARQPMQPLPPLAAKVVSRAQPSGSGPPVLRKLASRKMPSQAHMAYSSHIWLR